MIFVDSSFWIAVCFPRDAHHAESVDPFERHSRELVTSNHVRGETWTFLRRRLGHKLAKHFLKRLDSTRTTRVEFVSRELEA